MAYRPSRWPKIILAIPAVAVVMAVVGAGVSEQVGRYQNRAAAERAREAMRSCAAEHNVDFDWQIHPRYFTMDAEVRYFSAGSANEVAAAHCIIANAEGMSGVYEGSEPCLKPDAEIEVRRYIGGQHYIPAEENYWFSLYPCDPVSEEIGTQSRSTALALRVENMPVVSTTAFDR